MSNDELYHYGVLGMKWGVRHNPSKAMVKSANKLHKLDTKYEKKAKKAVKKRYGFFGSPEKYQKAKEKADKTAYKTKKWFDTMDNEFSKQLVTNISAKDIEIGKKYYEHFNQGADFTNSYASQTSRSNKMKKNAKAYAEAPRKTANDIKKIYNAI